MIGELTTSEVDILIILKIYHDNHILIAFMSHMLFFSDYYNLRRKSYASESGNISNSEQPHVWFINIACACIDDISEEFLN